MQQQDGPPDRRGRLPGEVFREYLLIERLESHLENWFRYESDLEAMVARLESHRAGQSPLEILNPHQFRLLFVYYHMRHNLHQISQAHMVD